MRYWWFIAALIMLVMLLMWQYPYVARNTENTINILYLVLMIALIASSCLITRMPLSRMLRDALHWLAIILLIALGYSYRADLVGSRLYGALTPSTVRVTAEGALRIFRAQDGHFHIEGEINGDLEPFLIDTGASDIVLTQVAAQAAGLNPKNLNYSRTYSTANGIVRGAPVTLKSLTIGKLNFENIPASVNQGQLEESLLGMTFLNQFKSYKVEDNQLTLTP